MSITKKQVLHANKVQAEVSDDLWKIAADLNDNGDTRKIYNALAAEKERTKKLNDEVQVLSKDRYKEQIRAEAAEERAKSGWEAALKQQTLRSEAEAQLAALTEKLEAIDSPQTANFIKAVESEVLHQKKRWGEDHDGQKTPEDWLWTLAFLSTKATQSVRYGDNEKYLHHIITAAALLANWHEHALSNLSPSPVADPANEKEKR